jgi:hypothetical protein
LTFISVFITLSFLWFWPVFILIWGTSLTLNWMMNWS